MTIWVHNFNSGITEVYDEEKRVDQAVVTNSQIVTNGLWAGANILRGFFS